MISKTGFPGLPWKMGRGGEGSRKGRKGRPRKHPPPLPCPALPAPLLWPGQAAPPATARLRRKELRVAGSQNEWRVAGPPFFRQFRERTPPVFSGKRPKAGRFGKVRRTALPARFPRGYLEWRRRFDLGAWSPSQAVGPPLDSLLDLCLSATDQARCPSTEGEGALCPKWQGRLRSLPSLRSRRAG